MFCCRSLYQGYSMSEFMSISLLGVQHVRVYVDLSTRGIACQGLCRSLYQGIACQGLCRSLYQGYSMSGFMSISLLGVQHVGVYVDLSTRGIACQGLCRYLYQGYNMSGFMSISLLGVQHVGVYGYNYSLFVDLQLFLLHFNIFF